MISTSLNHYRLTAKLGEGGMGEVYRATDTKLWRAVAIKVLPAHVSRDPQSLARFEREAKALATLNHPNVAAIHGFETDQGTHFLVLELVEGETLGERLRRGALPVKEALTIARQMAEAIQEAHEKGIIHRDLKPGNVKITSSGRVKVLDFGLAKLTVGTTCRSSSESGDAQQRVPTDADAPTLKAAAPETGSAETTTPGAVMGTPAYMSPEQARGHEVDKRTDVWAFGCCLFECLSGRRPFRGETASDLIAEVLKSEPDWSQLPTETPREVVTLLRRCLEKEPARRLSSIGDIALTLEETRMPAGSLSPSSARRSWNPLRAVAAGSLILVIGTGFYFWMGPGSNSKQQRDSQVVGKNTIPFPSAPSVADQKSVAVLPFANLSPDKADEYLSDGMTEELLNVLARVPGLRVPGRSSSFALKGKTEDGFFRKVGEQLNVSTVLDGSVRKAGDKLRITAQLINVADGFQLWSESYDREMTNIFAIQTDVAQNVAAALRIQLGIEEARDLVRKPTEDVQAYSLLLQGRFFYAKWTKESFVTSIDLLNQAVERDPKFALAYAQLAEVQTVSIYLFGSPQKVLPKALAAAQKALELDGALSDAHYAMGVVRLHDWKWKEAEREFKTALTINPKHAMSHDWYGWYFFAIGRMDEALREMRRAQELEPLHGIINPDLALFLIAARQYEKALAQCQYILKLDPRNFQGLMNLGWVHTLQGDFVNAALIFQQAKGLDPESGWVLKSMGWLSARSGNGAEAIEAIRNLERDTTPDSRHADTLAYIYAALGDLDQAFKWLDVAYEGKTPSVILLQMDPGWENLRTDPRYPKFLKKVGLAP